MKKFKAACGSLASLFLFAACALTPETRGGEPLWATPEVQERIVEDLQEREEFIQVLRARVLFKKGGRSVGRGGEVLLLVKAPLSFRVDHLSDFGTLQHQLFSDVGRLGVIWYQENRYFEGVGVSEEYERYLSLSLSTHEVVRFLLTHVLLGKSEDYQIQKTRKGMLLLKSSRQKIWVVKQGGDYLPVRVQYFDLEGEKRFEVQYADYDEAGETLFPRRIKGISAGGRVEILFDELEINPSLAPHLFDVEIPKGATRVLP
ncbi:MAG: DUF4292 domain-containing protein [Deltaproteobacteria bacterium]|nr:DUF4292 domain-containing protein [Deltaproteobacteria bacterium]MBI2501142.1 DUF4292 domain-containing protein [Deltaproteobacteria bacterium]